MAALVLGAALVASGRVADLLVILGLLCDGRTIPTLH
jgi:hypothetical protein